MPAAIIDPIARLRLINPPWRTRRHIVGRRFGVENAANSRAGCQDRLNNSRGW
jgi:hypothetical protein